MTGTQSLDGAVVQATLEWYRANRRDLPWRRPGVSAWEVLVSEVMLQQTPVVRVLPVYEEWISRWPAPRDLAAEPAAAPIRLWGRLGYPRRALWLHEAAQLIVSQHGGRVPADLAALLALPGVGAYTAPAVAAFAYRQRQVVLDTNVRRLMARLVVGLDGPRSASPTAGERRTAESLLPADGETAAQWSVAAMELGALVCTARSPGCARCPVSPSCTWRRLGKPTAGTRPAQRYEGTDRQARGRVLAMVRDSFEPVSGESIRAAWPEDIQRARALDALIADGLVEPIAADHYRLPLPD